MHSELSTADDAAVRVLAVGDRVGEVLPPAEVAARLDLDVDTVVLLLAQGALPGCKLAGSWRIWWPAVLERLARDPAGEVLRAPVVAHRLGLSEAAVLRLLAQGALPGRKLGKSWRIWWPAVVESLRGPAAVCAQGDAGKVEP